MYKEKGGEKQRVTPCSADPDGTETERSTVGEKDRERKRESDEGGVNEVAARQDLRGNANSAGSLIHRGLYQNLITSEAKATAKEER